MRAGDKFDLVLHLGDISVLILLFDNKNGAYASVFIGAVGVSLVFCIDLKDLGIIYYAVFGVDLHDIGNRRVFGYGHLDKLGRFYKAENIVSYHYYIIAEHAGDAKHKDDVRKRLEDASYYRAAPSSLLFLFLLLVFLFLLLFGILGAYFCRVEAHKHRFVGCALFCVIVAVVIHYL